MSEYKIIAPLVRVCVPVYNAAATFGVSLSSILTQTYRNIEVLIVDNSSDDGTLQIAEASAASDSRVKVLKNKTNIGAVPNLMRCISLAGGKYTAIFHADDIYNPEMIEKEVAFLEANPEAGAVFTMAVAIDSLGKPGKRFSLPSDLVNSGRKIYGFKDIFRSVLRNGNFLFTPSPLVRADVYAEVIKELRENVAGTSVDLDLWFRIIGAYPVGIINEPLLGYRMAKESFSYNHLRSKTSRHDLFLVLEHYLKNNYDWLSARDRMNYDFLLLKDDVNRAFNLYVSGKPREARRLLWKLFSPLIVARSALSGFRMKVLFMGLGTLLLSFLGLPLSMRDRISKARY